MEDEIVISGISGRFPESDNLDEFAENLFNKVDMVTIDNRRYEPGMYNTPRGFAKLKDIRKFDSQFFCIHNKQVHTLEPQIRILLETSYECMIDAGYDPESLRGKNIGVFVGACANETYDYFGRNPKILTGYTLTGCAQCMFPNRLSYFYDFKGPSFTMDTGCSASFVALHQAISSIQRGECEAALVAGTNLCLKPETSQQFNLLGVLSQEYHCKTFQGDRDGFVRAESITCIFLQKSSAARRKYATIVKSKINNDGYKDEGITYPSSEMQRRLLTQVYEECKLDPHKVTFVETHGTGTKVGDQAEVPALDKVFCQNGRKEPLLIGSVKTNMGHSEGGSGLNSIAKVIITIQQGKIPPNLHCFQTDPALTGIVEGRLKIVTEETPWDDEYIGVSNFGFGGVNVHVLLKPSPFRLKEKKGGPIPQLVLYGGRTEASLRYLFDKLDSPGKAPREFCSLLHQSAYPAPQKKPFRGYKLMCEEANAAVCEVKKTPHDKRPLWYVFSGMGSQWPCMAKQLMNLEIFAKSIRRSADALKPYGVDLIDLVTNEQKRDSKNSSTIPAFVSIAAVQVALVDVLRELGMEPDGMVGHSVGELGCAYADGCFTAEEMVLSAYCRGKAVDDTDLIEGGMIATGLTWAEAQKICPKGVYPSCHNAEDSVTISGPKDSLKGFIDTLKKENIFVREVDSLGYAFHSQYIFPAAGRLKSLLDKVIPNPKKRSSRWVCSSYPEERWNEPEVQISDAAYFVHNLISPVLFHEALRHVPKDAIVVEIAPHHLLQAIVKRVIGPDFEYIGLMKRNSDNVVQLLTSIGKLYTAGLNPDIERLYPPVAHPVPKGTPMIAPLIKWDHSTDWFVAKFAKVLGQCQAIIEVEAGPADSPDHYILGHHIDGRYLYPTTGYVLLVWQTFAEMKDLDREKCPVVFENVKIHRATLLTETTKSTFTVVITKAGGEFEISESGATVCTGRVYSPEDSSKLSTLRSLKAERKTFVLNASDVYKELKLRGYEYGPTFQGIIASDIDGNEGLLRWNGNWVVFLDTLLQFTILGKKKRALFLPTGFQLLVIDPVKHNEIVTEGMKELDGVPVKHDKHTNEIFAGGAQFKNLNANIAPRQPAKKRPLLEEYKFVPYDESCTLSQSEKERYERYIRVCSSVAKKLLELAGKSKGQIADVMDGFKKADDALVADYLKSVTDEHVLLKSLCSIMNIATSEDLVQHVKSHAKNYLAEREGDILSQTLVKDIPLRTVMDVVLENIMTLKIRIAEATEQNRLVSLKIEECVETFGVQKLTYSVAHLNADTVSKEDLPSAAEVISWDGKPSFAFENLDLFVLNYLSRTKKEFQDLLKSAASCVREGGFVAVLQRTRLLPAEKFLSIVGETVIPVLSEEDLGQIFKETNLNAVSMKSDSLASTLYLLRKPAQPSPRDSVIRITTDGYDQWLEPLKSKMAQSEASTDRIWLVGDGREENGIVGLAKCLRREPGGNNVRCVVPSKESPEFSLTSSFYKDVIRNDLPMNVFKEGTWGSYRHVPCKTDLTKVETEHAYVNVLTRGDLSSLTWIDSSMKFFTPSENSILCKVYYSALNFRDVMLASGKLPAGAIPEELALQECMLGFEFAGRDMTGQRIMGVLSSKAIATTVAADPHFMWKVPERWTLEEAATVPVAYSTAYYALVTRGNMKKGEKILIHAGSGGVGQAAISIALSIGCEVFASVGTPEKREFLKKRFPQLKDRNFCNSRDTTFERYILSVTNGQGVDAVLNSLADDKLVASLNCLATNGRFLEIGKYDLSQDTPLGMKLFLKNVSFHGIFLDALFNNNAESSDIKRQIVNLVNDGITNGTVRPLNTVRYKYNEVEQAFRFMASGRHIGKIVIKIRDEEPQKKVVPSPMLFPAIARTSFSPKKSYVIIGGLGGFGLELCEWLIEHGARNVILTSRSGVKTGYQELCLKRWQEEGVNVMTSKLNAIKLDEAKQLLTLAAKHGPVGGIFNLAMVLRDALIENQTVEEFRLVCDSKVASTKNMDALSRQLCPELEWFVCFSSVACGRGNQGQTNYGYANSVMEKICEGRRREGLPGLAIEWGAVAEVGALETVSLGTNIGGTIPQRISSCLSVLDKFLHQSRPVMSSCVPYQISETASKKSTKQGVLETVSNIFGIEDISSINPSTSLADLGMDSLMGVELKQCLERDYDHVLTTAELRQLKLKDLVDIEKGVGKAKTPEVEPSEKEKAPEK